MKTILMLTGEVIQRVQSLYSRGVESDDSRLTRRHIYNKLLSARSTLLFNKLNKNQYISQWNYQTIPCLELEVVPPHECPCILPLGCEILKSKEKLPKPINSIAGHRLQSVTSIDGKVVFDETTWKSKEWSVDDKYTANRPDYFIKDGYLYITDTRKLKVVTVMGLFNDPVEVTQVASLCDTESQVNCPVNPMEVEFTIDEDLLDTLVEMAAKELVILLGQINQDLANDAQDSSSLRLQVPRQRRIGDNEA